METLKSRRKFLSVCMGLASGLLVLGPGRAKAAGKDAGNIIRKLELDLIKSSRPKKDPTVVSRTSGGEFSLYRGTGKNKALLCRMNPTGKDIWESCDGLRTFREISESIKSRYQVSLHQAQTDTLVFIELLKDIGAVTL
jgi:hypothetical protein